MVTAKIERLRPLSYSTNKPSFNRLQLPPKMAGN
jgi:hypothetical protein